MAETHHPDPETAGITASPHDLSVIMTPWEMFETTRTGGSRKHTGMWSKTKNCVKTDHNVPGNGRNAADPPRKQD